jgi:hypothetical protein
VSSRRKAAFFALHQSPSSLARHENDWIAIENPYHLAS